MAELSLSQLIQESLQSNYIAEEEGQEKSFGAKAKEKAQEIANIVKGKAQGFADSVGGLNRFISKSDASDQHWRNRLAKGWWDHRNKIAAGAGVAGTAAVTYGAYKGGKALANRISSGKGVFGLGKSRVKQAKHFIKNNPGKAAAGASLAALGAGAGAAALIRYLRKKRKHQ